jgi:hypothetical protein
MPLLDANTSTVPVNGAGSCHLPPGRVAKGKTRHRAPALDAISKIQRLSRSRQRCRGLSFATWAGSKRQDAAPCPLGVDVAVVLGARGRDPGVGLGQLAHAIGRGVEDPAAVQIASTVPGLVICHLGG